ncbi:DUF2332 domain-containing protein [Ureibacillus acetophenoni]|uniref:DUF2332 domain-containing protein n=1 Tax=Ureibacillus acetophenoni TaxID=614649 RepID=A0A285UL93_9BACL|nr:DUF2332 domain-containing protein [Ureibacillus acetophenoni]SOC42533.1 hypothetical protein SAMN05877842_11325 [Ureibacillus acetophenoni]
MDRLVKIFSRFGELEAQKSSPLYAYWSKKVAEDYEILKLVSYIPASQPKPNMLFASVQYLASKKNHPLNYYYTNFDRSESFLEESYQHLKDFVRHHEEEILDCFQTRLIQTNELNRSSYLYPIFSEIAHESDKPLTLIEIGTSAGLLLNLDHYGYEISENGLVHRYGETESTVVVRAENFGEPLSEIKPFEVKERIGIDLNIVDLNKEEDFDWMQALIWPEQTERKELLKTVRELNKNVPKKLYKGDFLKLIPSFIEKHDTNTQLVLFHTHVANQLNEQLKQELLKMIESISEQYPIYHVYNNMYDSYLHVDYVTHSKTYEKKVLQGVDGHGKHYHWLN